MRRVSAALVALVIVAVIGRTTFHGKAHESGRGFARETQGASRPASPADPLAEFPPWDRTVRDQVRAGLAVEKASQLLSEAPESAETAEALLAVAPSSYQAQDRTDDALRVIGSIFQKHPESIARTIEAILYHSYSFETDAARDRRPELGELLDVARRQISSLPKSQAADLAYQVARMQAWVERTREGIPAETLKALMQQYPGTDGGSKAELAILSRSFPYPAIEKRVEALARFAVEHRGTCAAAEALRMESTDVGSGMGTRSPSGEDPTERALVMLQIEEELSSPAYTSCRPTFGRSPAYAFASKPVYAPGNVDRLLQAYRGYLKTHLTAAAGDPDNGVGYLVTRVVRGLFRAKGEGDEALDRFLAELETEVPAPDAVRYLRAVVHEPITTGEGVGDAMAPQSPTVAQLADLHKAGSGLFQRKALATLAWLYGFYGDTQRARQYYSEYAKQYPESAYAWVAALRAAECASELGDWKTAASEYQAASRRYSPMPLARVLAHTYGARALEALNDFEHAKIEYGAALTGWDRDYDPRMTLATQHRPRPSAGIADSFRDPLEVTPLVLETRLAQLTRTLAAPGGAVLEQGRWLLDHGKRKEAAALVGAFATRYPKSANGPEAQSLAHRARLFDALEMLNVEGEANETAGLAALEGLSGEPYDFPVTAAKITRACVLWKQGKQAEAARLMEAALRERVARQQTREPASPLEKDIADIRRLLLLPTGGGPYSQARGWNAFSWPASLPPFIVVSAQARVKTVDGAISNVALYQRFPGLADVLLVDDEDLDFFSRMMNTVGGTKKRPQQAIMETPNQPIGPSLDVMKFLNKFFPVRQGHWGGWEFLTYPVIRQIEFMDASRTRARASVTVGYSGCDVLLEKSGGAWKATGMTNMWVT